MLMMRARSWALRDGFADVLRGLSIREEVEDFDRPCIALQSLASSPSPPLSANVRRHPVPRPRLADYVAASDTSAINPNNRSQIRTLGARDGLRLIGAHDVPTSVPAAEFPSHGSGHPPTDLENHATDPVIPAGVPKVRATPREAPAPIPSSSNGSPDNATEKASSYSLIEAEGNVIEVYNLEELREAFERLFTDPYLSADQITGRWESNELARQQLTEAFGPAVLEEARHRHLGAMDHREVQPSRRLTTRKRKTNTVKTIQNCELAADERG
jgi:hypothetical protein